MARFSKRSTDNLIGVHPDLVKVMEESIKTTPVDFTIVEGVRTLERQQKLYAQGRTEKGNKVTNADGVKNKSNHQVKPDGYGYAVDVYPYVDGSVRVSEKYVIPKLKEIADHIKSIAKKLSVTVVWGGDWKNPYDPPHFELKR